MSDGDCEVCGSECDSEDAGESLPPGASCFTSERSVRASAIVRTNNGRDSIYIKIIHTADQNGETNTKYAHYRALCLEYELISCMIQKLKRKGLQNYELSVALKLDC